MIAIMECLSKGDIILGIFLVVCLAAALWMYSRPNEWWTGEKIAGKPTKEE